MKKVSVVLCTYNGGCFLREQLDSLFNQTYPLYEIIIQDDGSTDSTCAIIAEYAAKWSCISFYINEDHGINNNFYSAMRKAKGELIAICDQDDIWEKDKIAKQVSAIGDHLMCAGRTKPFSEDGSFVYYDSRMPNISLFRMLYCAEIAGHTMLINRQLLDILPMTSYAVQTRCYDIVFSIVAAAFDSIVYLDTVLVHQRRYITANTYTSIEKSLPTTSNYLYRLKWTFKNYRVIKQKSIPIYRDWEELLRRLNANTSVCSQGIHLMQLQQSLQWLDVIRLSFFCLQHRQEILHTRGRFPMNAIQAILFPFTSCYYQRKLLEEDT